MFSEDSEKNNQIYSQKVMELISFCEILRTRQEMQNFMKISDREYFRTKILNPLINKGIIMRSIPDKLRSKNQKYYSFSIKE